MLFCFSILVSFLTFKGSSSKISDCFKNETDQECSKSDTTLYCYHIPKDLPTGIEHFYLQQNFKFPIELCEISSETFKGKNWNNLRLLHLNKRTNIKANAMKSLKSLQELNIRMEFFNDESLAGLNNLRTLGLVGGTLLHLTGLSDAIANRTVLPNLKTISFKKARLNIFSKIYLKDFLNSPLKSLDIHFIEAKEPDFINLLLFSKCPYKVNISGSIFNYDHFDVYDYSYNSVITSINAHGSETTYLKKMNAKRRMENLKVFDASYIVSPTINAYVDILLKVQNRTFTPPLEIVTLFSRAEIVNITGIYRQHIAIKVSGISVNIVQYFLRSSPTKEFIARENNIQHLDVTFPCNNSKLERLDLSSNVIEFIQPNMCLCCTRLTEINLSKNNLFKMAAMNNSVFGNIFDSYRNLKYVQLSFNQLYEVPSNIFQQNTLLDQIDLSNNFLTKISFNIGHMVNLRTLNLQKNRLLHLDNMPLKNLILINAPCPMSNNCSGVLKIDNNPFSCSECEELSLLKKLASSNFINRDENNIFCKNYIGTSIRVDQNAVDELQEECERPKRIQRIVIVSVVASLATIVLKGSLICTLIKYRRRRLRQRNIKEKIELIRLNQLGTRFVVFLSHSSEDTCFVNKYVYDPLNEHLQEKFQTDREVICLGDRHFKLGKPINDEMVRSLQQSAVVLLVLTSNFCKSEFCRMEYDHALFMKKPFILMAVGELDINDMVPSLQELFRRNTRLLWEKDGDTFIMKTTWENVSSSILDLI